MTDYISREAAFNAILKLVPKVDDDGYCWVIRGDAAMAIDSLLAADVRPVVKGKWMPKKEDVDWGNYTVRYYCSHCGRLPHFDKESFKFLLSEFCPKCGADMREEKK